jgi:hypothetical protein
MFLYMKSGVFLLLFVIYLYVSDERDLYSWNCLLYKHFCNRTKHIVILQKNWILLASTQIVSS